MKTLLVCYVYLNENGGGAFATKAYINAFASLSDEVTLVYKEKPGHAPKDIDSKVRLIPIHDTASRPVKFAKLLTGTLHPFRHTVQSLLESGDYDTVVFTSSISSFGLIDYAHEAGCHVYTIHQNCEYDYYKDNSSGVIRPIILHWVKHFERDAIQKSDRNFMLTMQDIDSMRDHYGIEVGNASVIGVFEFNAQELPVVSPECSSSRYVITGRLSDMQTSQSISRWASTIFPTIFDMCKGSSVVVAGKDPSVQLTELLQLNGCRVVASPESMDPILMNADIYLNPVDMGSGLKLRNMDGLKYGLPVICHAVSAKGYEAFLGKALFSYTDFPSFQNALQSALNIKMDKMDIQELYRSQFFFSEGCKRLKDILSE